MGKTQEETNLSERVQAARMRAETLIRRQGRRAIHFDDLLAQGSPAEESDDEFLAELRQWRSEGDQRP